MAQTQWPLLSVLSKQSINSTMFCLSRLLRLIFLSTGIWRHRQVWHDFYFISFLLQLHVWSHAKLLMLDVMESAEGNRFTTPLAARYLLQLWTWNQRFRPRSWYLCRSGEETWQPQSRRSPHSNISSPFHSRPPPEFLGTHYIHWGGCRNKTGEKYCVQD